MNRLSPIVLLVIGYAIAAPAVADTVVATRTVRANTVVLADQIGLKSGDTPGTYQDLSNVTGMEARVALYAGRPVRLGDVGPPAIVERNQIVTLIFSSGGLLIRADARALARGGVGDRIRAMNLASHSSLFGQIQPDGTLLVTR